MDRNILQREMDQIDDVINKLSHEKILKCIKYFHDISQPFQPPFDHRAAKELTIDDASVRLCELVAES
jgi:hypothetical protein